jgi:hypothetical protein
MKFDSSLPLCLIALHKTIELGFEHLMFVNELMPGLAMLEEAK